MAILFDGSENIIANPPSSFSFWFRGTIVLKNFFKALFKPQDKIKNSQCFSTKKKKMNLKVIIHLSILSPSNVSHKKHGEEKPAC